jgi:hypothetical protein
VKRIGVDVRYVVATDVKFNDRLAAGTNLPSLGLSKSLKSRIFRQTLPGVFLAFTSCACATGASTKHSLTGWHSELLRSGGEQ